MMWSARRLAWSLWILTLVVAVVELALMVWDWSAPVPALFGIRGFAGLFAVCFGGVGVLLTWRRPGHPVGWIFAAAGLVEAVDFATFEYGLAASAGRRNLPAAGYVGWAQLWLWVPFVALVTVYLFLLFPDGRLPSPRWRPVGWLSGAFAVLAIAGLSFFPGSEAPNLPALRNPFGVHPGSGAARCDHCRPGRVAVLRGAGGLVAGRAHPAGDIGTAAADQVAGLRYGQAYGFN